MNLPTRSENLIPVEANWETIFPFSSHPRITGKPWTVVKRLLVKVLWSRADKIQIASAINHVEEYTLEMPLSEEHHTLWLLQKSQHRNSGIVALSLQKANKDLAKTFKIWSGVFPTTYSLEWKYTMLMLLLLLSVHKIFNDAMKNTR